MAERLAVLPLRVYKGKTFELQLWIKEHDFPRDEFDPLLLKAETPLYDLAVVLTLDREIGRQIWYHPLPTFDFQPLVGALPRFGWHQALDAERESILAVREQEASTFDRMTRSELTRRITELEFRNVELMMFCRDHEQDSVIAAAVYDYAFMNRPLPLTEDDLDDRRGESRAV